MEHKIDRHDVVLRGKERASRFLVIIMEKLTAGSQGIKKIVQNYQYT